MATASAPRDKRSETAGADAGARARAPDRAAPLPQNQELQALFATGALRAQLQVGAADDPAEAQADRVAAAVMADAPCPLCAAGASPCPGCAARARRTPRAGAAPAPGGVSRLGLGDGRALAPRERSRFESAFGMDLAGVRVHDDARAARNADAMAARAFSVGEHVAFAAGEHQPHTPEGQRLLAHELAHVALGHGGVRRETLPAPDPDRESDEPLPADSGDEDTFGVAKRPFAWDLDPKRPEYIWVSADASRNEIALNVLGDGLRMDAFDFVSPHENFVEAGDSGFATDPTRRAIRLRQPDTAPEALRAKTREALDKLVDAAVQETVSRITGGSGSTAAMVLRWSRYADFHDASGVNYFERYLRGLESRTIVTTRGIGSWRWGRKERNALQDILAELEGPALEIVRKAMTLRGQRDVGYTVPDATPKIGTVVGRWISEHDDAMVPIHLGQTLVEAGTRAEAEIRTRSSSHLGDRVVMAGADGRFYGYAVVYAIVSGGGAIPGIEHGTYAWYYPDVLFIGAGDFEAQGIEMGPDTAYVLDMVGDALARTTPENAEPLYGLDYGVLQVASMQQRLEIFRAVLDAGAMGQAAAVAVLTRTLLTMPATDFPAFDRELDKRGLTKRLIDTRENANRSALAQLGQAFTLQTMASRKLDAESFGDPTVLELGEVQYGTAYYQATAGTTKAQVVAPDPWDPKAVPPATAQGPGPVRESALPGEQPGEIDRTTLSFEYGAVPESQADSSRWNRRSRTQSRVFLPGELLSLEVHHGGKSSRRIVSALEAALIQGDPQKEASGKDFADFVDMLMLLSAMKGLRVIGGMAARAAATGSLRAGMALLGEQLATQAGKQAVRSVVDYALLSAAHYASEHQEELEKTPQGRLFMSLTTTAIALVAVRDVRHLMESGLPGRLLAAGKEALGVASAAARRGIVATMREFRAAQIAHEALRAEATAVELAGGLGQVGLGPLERAQRFGALFRVARGQAAKEMLIESIVARGGSTARAESALARLEKAAGGSKGAITEAEKTAARAYADVAQAAQAMPPAQLEKFLDALEDTLSVGGRQAADMAPALRGALKAADPVAALRDLQALAASKLSPEAFKVLCAKAGRFTKEGRAAVDLGWLRTTNLPPERMEALARDPNTPWNLFMDASRNPADTALQLRAMARLRGASAEAVAGESAEKLVPGWRIDKAQVEMGESVIDWQLKSTARTGTKRALEVKGWTRGTWKENLDLWEKFHDVPVAKLTSEQRNGVRAVEHMVGQLEDAAAVQRAADPVLAVSGNIGKNDLARLKTILRDRLNRPVEVILLDEQAIVAGGAELRKGLNIPGPQQTPKVPVE